MATQKATISGLSVRKSSDGDVFSLTVKPPTGPVIIIVWMQKGGVAKTTHVAQIASIYAAMKFKVLQVDADPQCDTTKLATWRIMNSGAYDEGPYGDSIYENFIYRKLDNPEDDARPRTLYDALKVVEPGEPMQAAYCPLLYEFKNGGGVWLLPGHPNLSDWDTYIVEAEGTALSHRSGYMNMRNFFGAPHAAIMMAASNLKHPDHVGPITADIILIDASPSPGRLNCSLFMSSHFAIIPTFPEFLTVLDTNITVRTIEKWHNIAKTIFVPESRADQRVKYVFPDHFPKVLGYLTSRYDISGRGVIGENGIVEISADTRLRDQADLVSKNVDRLVRSTASHMRIGFERLRKLNPPLALPESARSTLCLGNIRTFNQNGAISQLTNVPVCFLTTEHMVKYTPRGVERMDAGDGKPKLEDIDKFRSIYVAIVRNINSLIRISGIDLPEVQDCAKRLILSSLLREVPTFGTEKILPPANHHKKAIPVSEESSDDSSGSQSIASSKNGESAHSSDVLPENSEDLDFEDKGEPEDILPEEMENGRAEEPDEIEEISDAMDSSEVPPKAVPPKKAQPPLLLRRATPDEIIDACLVDEDLRRLETPGEGNCWFYAVSYHKYGTFSHHLHVRERLINFYCQSVFGIDLQTLHRYQRRGELSAGLGPDAGKAGSLSKLSFTSNAGRWLQALIRTDPVTAQDPLALAEHMLNQSTPGEFVEINEMSYLTSMFYKVILRTWRFDGKKVEQYDVQFHPSNTNTWNILHRGIHYEVLLPIKSVKPPSATKPAVRRHPPAKPAKSDSSVISILTEKARIADLEAEKAVANGASNISGKKSVATKAHKALAAAKGEPYIPRSSSKKRILDTIQLIGKRSTSELSSAKRKLLRPSEE